MIPSQIQIQEIIKRIDELNEKVGHDVMLVHDFNMLCRTRIDSIEQLFFKDRVSMLKVLFLAVFLPLKLKYKLEQIHNQIIMEYRVRINNRKKDLVTAKQKTAILN